MLRKSSWRLCVLVVGGGLVLAPGLTGSRMAAQGSRHRRGVPADVFQRRRSGDPNDKQDYLISRTRISERA